jgi:D-alanyl-D-alanine dipeptidase
VFAAENEKQWRIFKRLIWHMFTAMQFPSPGLVIFLVGMASCAPENAQTYQGDLQSPALPVMPVISDLERRFLEYGLVDLGELKPDIRVDLQYSGTNNIMHTDMYGSLEKAYLHPDAAQKLVKASTLLKEQHGLQLLIYDAARPLSVQKWMWEQLDLPYSEKIRFLNPPEKTSLHNYGAAVDLTIIDADGVPLDMGTPYDDPSSLAYPIREAENLKNGLLTAEQVHNRQILRNMMLEAGFTGIDSEWWHFNSCTRAHASTHYTLIE